MLSRKTDLKKFTIPGGTEGFLHPSSLEGDFSIAQVIMDGVYPKSGYSINDISKETLLMIDGTFNVEVEGEEFKLNKGDMLIIHPNKKYRIKGKGEAVDVITPAWEKNKNQIIEK